jgi:hypothetical protein
MHSTRTVPLKLSTKALSVGLPDREKSSATPLLQAQRSGSFEMKSGSLSTRMFFSSRHTDQRIHDVRPLITLSNINRRRHLREGIDDRQHPDLRPVEQLVRQEVHRPYPIGRRRRIAVFAQLRRNLPLRPFVAQCCKDTSRTCSSARSADQPKRCAGITLASAIGQQVGRSRAASSPRSSGIRANSIRASASS